MGNRERHLAANGQVAHTFAKLSPFDRPATDQKTPTSRSAQRPPRESQVPFPLALRLQFSAASATSCRAEAPSEGGPVLRSFSEGGCSKSGPFRCRPPVFLLHSSLFKIPGRCRFVLRSAPSCSIQLLTTTLSCDKPRPR